MLPFGNGNFDGVRHGLWRLTDARYREAVEAFLDKKSQELTYCNPDREFRSFERRKPSVDLGWKKLPEVDTDHWVDYVERASALIKRFPEVEGRPGRIRGRPGLSHLRQFRRRSTDRMPIDLVRRMLHVVPLRSR